MSNTWLNEYSKNITSQTGEDGIIEKILEIIPHNNKWCVEFGAWNGKAYSNTFNLISNKGYSAVLIEGDSIKYKDLINTFKDNKSVIPVNTFVGFDDNSNLDKILGNYDIPLDFDLLSIDIDGNDYHVWDACQIYRPKIVCIEYNPTIPNEVEFVQPKDMKINQGSSLLSIYNLAETKNYKLVAATPYNALFVDAKYFELFNINDNSVQTMRLCKSNLSYIFTGYDGTIFIRGEKILPWHDMQISESKLQTLPAFLRRYPDNYNKIQKKLFYIYRNLKNKILTKQN